MASPMVALRDLHFSYPQSAEPLFAGVSAVFPPGFTAVIGPNGSGKSTLLKLLASELPMDSGTLEGVSQVVYCEQRTDHRPAQLAALLADWDADAFELRGRLEVPEDALQRWGSLSQGERKRVQIACALWQRPTLLLIDEPTNHVDEAGRAVLEEALQRFDGVGVIVSHDRELLDSVCIASLWLQPPSLVAYPGGYSVAQQLRAQARLGQQRHREQLRTSQRRLQAEVVRRRERASRADAQRSKRGIAAKDSDARDRVERSRATGRDGTAGKLLRQLDGRATRTQAALDAVAGQKDYASGIWVAGEISQADSLFRLPPGQLELGARRRLSHPELLMRSADRVALTGANGAGKTTLLNAIKKVLKLPEERLVVLPQELTVEESSRLLDSVRRLPAEQLGRVMSIVSRLGSRPAPLLDSRQPSPGEVRKLLLALGIVQQPHLLILDEPTNHLDALAIESLEEALVACPCGLLVVSHDRRLLDRLTTIRWRIERQSTGDSQLTR